MKKRIKVSYTVMLEQEQVDRAKAIAVRLGYGQDAPKNTDLALLRLLVSEGIDGATLGTPSVQNGLEFEIHLKESGIIK